MDNYIDDTANDIFFSLKEVDNSTRIKVIKALKEKTKLELKKQQIELEHKLRDIKISLMEIEDV